MAAESKLEGECRKLAMAQGWELLKWKSPGVNGVPDRILLGPRGYIVFIEFKAPGKKPTVAQVGWSNRLQELGFEVWLIDKLVTFIELLPSS